MLNFLAFVYLARRLGVANYGVLEFGLSILLYLVWMSDAGLEIWATREKARGRDVLDLASVVIPAKLILGIGIMALLILAMPLLPNYPYVRPVVLLFALTVLVQPFNLRWVFMGDERMSSVAIGGILSSLVFFIAVFSFIRIPQHVVWIPVIRLIGDSCMVIYFWLQYSRLTGRLWVPPRLTGVGKALRQSIVLGASNGLSLMSFNFDSILIGFLLGTASVGLYGAAYKPVLIMLALPVTYFLGLFPVLSRLYEQKRTDFTRIIQDSLRLMAVVALPVGVLANVMARPIVKALFGADYSQSAPVFQVLTWSAVLVMLRGTFRRGLNAAGKQKLDLKCAAAATCLNVILNLVMIPLYGIMGAAASTLASEILWFASTTACFRREVVRLPLLSLLAPAIVSSVAMAMTLWLTRPFGWLVSTIIGFVIYSLIWCLLGQPRILIQSLMAKGVRIE
jgi:O-antigen/teichoic acid export membrane protein